MRLSQLLSIGLLATVGLSAIAQVASAAPKFINYGVNNDIVGVGFSPAQKVEITYGSVSLDKDVNANSCGFATISNLTLASSVTINGTTSAIADITNLQIASNPNQAAGPSTSAADCPWGNYKNKSPQLDGTYKFFVGGLTPGARYPITITGASIRKVTANACGQIKLANSGDYLGKSFSYGGSAVTPTAIAAAPQCKDGTALLPIGFPGLVYTP